MNEVIISMQNQYSTSKICPYNKPDCADSEKLTLEPDLEQILATSTNPDELDYVWKVNGTWKLYEWWHKYCIASRKWPPSPFL